MNLQLLHFSTGLSDVLEPFTELVNNRFDNWLKQQEAARQSSDASRHSREGGNPAFSPEQLAWLNKIKNDAQGSANVVGDRTSGMTKSPKMPK